MRKLVCVGFAAVCSIGAAMAADVPVALPVKAPPPAPSGYNWTGIYVGAHVGYGAGMKDWLWFGGPFFFEAKGFLGGGQIGVNQQVGNLVFGIEADASWADIKGTQNLRSGGTFTGSVQTGTTTSRIDSVATVAGRLGLAAQRWLVYVKAGAAWTHEVHASDRTLTDIAPPLFAPIRETIRGGEGRMGALLGFGAEYAVAGNWSVKLEYNYLAFQNREVEFSGTLTFGGAGGTFTTVVQIEQAIHLARIGINYRFDMPATQSAITPALPPPGFDWSGAYIGVQAGYGWGGKEWTTFAPVRRFDVSGWLAGATIGANAQAGALVLGVEAEWAWTDITGRLGFVQPSGGTGTLATTISSTVDWLGLASIRLGFVAADRWLFYVKGGIAVADERHTFDVVQVIPGVGSAVANLVGNRLHTGPLAGAGLEWAFAGNWSAKLEYNYVNFGLQSLLATGPQTVVTTVTTGRDVVQSLTIRQHLHLVKYGINYHFSPQPDVVAARY